MYFKINISDMPRVCPTHYKCFNCPRSVKPKYRHKISMKYKAVITALTGRAPSDHDFLCSRCQCMCNSHIKVTSFKTQVEGKRASSSAAAAATEPPIMILLGLRVPFATGKQHFTFWIKIHIQFRYSLTK